MNVIIYAAGISKRLFPDNENGLKGLIKVKNKRIIEYQLDWISNLNIKKIIIVIGMEHERYKEVIGHSYNNVEVQYVYNNEYLKLGNMMSLWFARNYCDDDILFTTSDLICHPSDIDTFKPMDFAM